MATAVLRNSQISEAEWQARQELAACYRVFAMLGWDEMIYNHITVKVPDEEDAFLINPFGLHFSEVKASNLVKIDIDGNKLDDNPYPVNLAGFVQHSVFHRNLPDAHCIMHTHTTAGMAVSSLEGGLQPVNFYAANFIGQIAYHDFEGVTVRSEEGARLIEHLGDKRAMLLKNHGILVMGRTLPEAFIKHWSLQRACEIQMATLSMGKPLTIPPEVIAVHQRDLSKVQIPGGAGRADFDAMVRRVDKIDTSWRE
ncbi:class II aldolase/adducin family protein [Sphingomonas sp. MAH-20]|uniref:Class II aldolase/adducin family protein n=1 Tax=Sphingomonas horti TaxID=2682842 RepID=A0A6I4J8H4_9SPHN|nr:MULTISPECIES: class II aldolase/adducin family protein [Sphingomonas]MBA2919069.1 class II aldolase/adducin family protein [Sphingomonas sp. CGMCC 1.13658]MVO79101.1 class II aldolase/adducin family protein [Sphingomonas horti]